MSGPNYDPKTHDLITYHDAVAKFNDGSDTPRDYLERCLERIDAIENEVMAWEVVNRDAAREAADEAGARYKAGAPLSLVDGMPIGIKDLIETVDMPTEYGSELFKGNQPIRDAASVNALRKGGAEQRERLAARRVVGQDCRAPRTRVRRPRARVLRPLHAARELVQHLAGTCRGRVTEVPGDACV